MTDRFFFVILEIGSPRGKFSQNFFECETLSCKETSNLDIDIGFVVCFVTNIRQIFRVTGIFTAIEKKKRESSIIFLLGTRINDNWRGSK